MAFEKSIAALMSPQQLVVPGLLADLFFANPNHWIGGLWGASAVRVGHPLKRYDWPTAGQSPLGDELIALAAVARLPRMNLGEMSLALSQITGEGNGFVTWAWPSANATREKLSEELARARANLSTSLGASAMVTDYRELEESRPSYAVSNLSVPVCAAVVAIAALLSGNDDLLRPAYGISAGVVVALAVLISLHTFRVQHLLTQRVRQIKKAEATFAAMREWYERVAEHFLKRIHVVTADERHPDRDLSSATTQELREMEASVRLAEKQIARVRWGESAMANLNFAGTVFGVVLGIVAAVLFGWICVDPGFL